MVTEKVSIIVPFFNRWDLTHQCLYDLYKIGVLSDTPKFEVILVDDCSTDKDIIGGFQWWRNNFGQTFHYYRKHQNEGFGRSMNFGVEKATGDIVILLSNDVRIHAYLPIEQSVEYLQDNDRVIVGHQLVDWKAGWNEFSQDGKTIIIKYLYGYFLALRKSDFMGLGGFDDIYAPYDYEDVDLCTKAQLLGYNLVEIKSSAIIHQSGGTINMETRLQHTIENREKYLQKWSFEKLLEIGVVL